MLQAKVNLAILVFVSVWAGVSAPLAAGQSGAGAVYEQPGPFRVETVESFTFEDDQRERDVVTRIYGIHPRYQIYVAIRWREWWTGERAPWTDDETHERESHDRAQR